MASRRQLILESVRERLKAIQPANGYQTDAGLAVYLGERPELGENEPPNAIALEVGEEQSEAQDITGRTLFVRLPLFVSAVTKADLGNDAWTAAEAILADIKKAMEQDDVTLGGLLERSGLERASIRTSDREPGSLIVGITATYVAPYLEAWGAP